MPDAWQDAQDWELMWHGSCVNSTAEEEKQLVYARKMGLSFYEDIHCPYNLDLGHRSVIDLGAGPYSLLLKATRLGQSYVVDPLLDKFPGWVRERYRQHGLEMVAAPGETVVLPMADEVWIYNVLEHVQDPRAFLENAKRLGKTLRIFEWLETRQVPGHLHRLTAGDLDRWLGGRGTVEWLNENGCVGKSYHGIFRTERKEGMRFHLLGLAHTKTNRQYMWCAFTQKVLKMAHMLTDLGHEVIHYGADGSEVPCEHVTVIDDRLVTDTYGDYDWSREPFRFELDDAVHRAYTANCIREIRQRKRDDDFLLLPFGRYQQEIADGVSLPLTVESGIGYDGLCKQSFRVFESYAWMHYLYGKYHLVDDGKAHWYDAVIPNYFDLNDFTLQRNKGNYVAFLGRLNVDKGVQIAIDVARELGRPILLAGQGDLSRYNTDGVRAYHLGSVGAERRNELLGFAQMAILPTTYIEPFGGTAVEAQLTGTPVLTTDWGAFSETVLHGITGFRCRTFDDFLWAANHVSELSPVTIRKWAEQNYSMARVGQMYQEYFLKVYDLLGQGWYARHPERQNLDWMKRTWPK